MSEVYKVVDLLCYVLKDDIIVMLLCMLLIVLFDMVIVISVGIVLVLLLFMCCIVCMICLVLVVVDVLDDVLVLCVIGLLFFVVVEGLFMDLELCFEGKWIVILKWDVVLVFDVGGFDVFQCFVKCLFEGCELCVCNVEFQLLCIMVCVGI